jgi:hypothetical protein
MVLKGAVGSEEVADGAGEEKTAILCKPSLVIAFVVLIFVFFLFSVSAGDRNVAAQVRGPTPRFWDVVVSA